MKPAPLLLSRCLLVASLCTFGCQVEDALRKPDPDLNRMLEVPRYDAYERSHFFDDGMTMRTPPEGTVAHSTGPRDPALEDGMMDGAYVRRFPITLTKERLERGKAHFERVCAACHGMVGSGDTVVATHMRRPPPSLHEARIVKLPVGRLYHVIEAGYGYMPSYASHFDVEGRWAIVAYVRALQRSQGAKLDELTSALALKARKELR